MEDLEGADLSWLLDLVRPRNPCARARGGAPLQVDVTNLDASHYLQLRWGQPQFSSPGVSRRLHWTHPRDRLRHAGQAQ